MAGFVVPRRFPSGAAGHLRAVPQGDGCAATWRQRMYPSSSVCTATGPKTVCHWSKRRCTWSKRRPVKKAVHLMPAKQGRPGADNAFAQGAHGLCV